jgi:hypothetical protein
MSRVRVVPLAALALIIGFAFGTSSAVPTATASGSELFEAAYYQGDEVTLLFPSHLSENPNLFTSGCLSIGPIAHWPDPTAKLYNMFVPGATHGGSCADGSLRHNHVTSTAPGDPYYTGAWHVIRVTAGPNFDIAKMPYKSENEVLLGAAAGELRLADTGASVRASVVFGR